jgi:hypothetical protein
MVQSSKWYRERLSALMEVALPYVMGGLTDTVGFAEVAPIIFIGAEGTDFFSLRGKSKIGVDDGEGAVFLHQLEQPG